VEVAMQEAVFNFVRVPTMSMYITNEPSPRVGNRLASGAIGDIYKCAPGGTNDYVYMLCTTPEMFQAMCKTIGRPDVVEDPRFKDRRERVKYIEELTRIIEDWTSKRGKHEVQQLMGAAGVPCGAILDSLELLNDPHMKERGMDVTVDHPVRGKFTMPGCPIKLEDSPAEVIAAPLLGQHNGEIYGEMLGLSEAELARLKQEGIV